MTRARRPASPQLDLWARPMTREAMIPTWCRVLREVIPFAVIHVASDWTNDRCAEMLHRWHMRLEWEDEHAYWLGWATRLPASEVGNGDIWRTADPYYGGAEHDPAADIWDFKMGLHRDIQGEPMTWLVSGRGQRELPADALRVALARCIKRRNEWHECRARRDPSLARPLW